MKTPAIDTLHERWGGLEESLRGFRMSCCFDTNRAQEAFPTPAEDQVVPKEPRMKALYTSVPRVHTSQ